MPLIVVFGFILTVLVFLSFFGVCLYICFQCYVQGSGGGGGENEETRVAAAVDTEELNRQIQSAVEKLTKPSAENEEAAECMSECAICLEEFGDRGSCRVFPNCNHMFHTDCIINWLRLNRTCPICRTRL